MFGIYPAAKEFHFTADGQAFSEMSNAANHAKTLEVKDTVKITKSMAAAGTIDVPSNPEPAKVEGGAKNEFQKLGAKSESGLDGAAEEAEKAAIAAKIEELSGKKPAANAKLDTLKAKLKELEDAAAEEAAKAAANATGADGSGEGDNQNEQK